MAAINERRAAEGKPALDIDLLPLDDAPSYQLFARGDTVAVFQFESAGMQHPVAAVEDQELRDIMRDEIKRLPEREKLVLSLYYDEGLTLAEIGQVLGVTESRVSQIHTKSVLHLRSRLSAAGVG